MNKKLNIISVSIGSSSRDKIVNTVLNDIEVTIERRGTDGDMQKAIDIIKSIDGKVDAIGLGGIDLYLVTDNRKYIIKDAKKMADAAKISPVVDGSGLKNTLERQTLNYLAQNNIIDFHNKKVLLVAGVDRFGMAETFPELGANVLYGDLIFALGIPFPIRKLNTLKIIARLILPIICKLPFEIIYPTGNKQEKESGHKSKRYKYFEEADIIAGDFHYISRYMPDSLTGKIIITNTTTTADIERLFEHGVSMVVSTTPNFDGRSFGTNLCEGIIVALAGKKPEDMTNDDYKGYLEKLNWAPNIIKNTETS